MSVALSTIGQISLCVSDVGAAVDFYRDVLGLRFLFSAGPHLAFLDAGGIRIMLCTPQGAGEAGKNSILYFSVQAIDQVYAEVVARGAAAERPPALAAQMGDHDLWLAFIRDPEGNLLGLMEEKPPTLAT